MSGLVVAFMLLDAGMKLVPFGHRDHVDSRTWLCAWPDAREGERLPVPGELQNVSTQASIDAPSSGSRIRVAAVIFRDMRRRLAATTTK
jgi:hypothetical protein